MYIYKIYITSHIDNTENSDNIKNTKNIEYIENIKNTLIPKISNTLYNNNGFYFCFIYL